MKDIIVKILLTELIIIVSMMVRLCYFHNTDQEDTLKCRLTFKIFSITITLLPFTFIVLTWLK
jgi:hypothetical protein